MLMYADQYSLELGYPNFIEFRQPKRMTVVELNTLSYFGQAPLLSFLNLYEID